MFCCIISALVIKAEKMRDSKTGQFTKQVAEDRFWEKVDKRDPDECWPWLASKDHCGYGMFWLDGRTIHASRAVWQLVNGTIPKNINVCHSCDTPDCVNPSHLFLGTDLDNQRDKARKGRAAVNKTGFGKSGTKHHRSVLNDELVIAARKAYKSGVYGAVGKLAKRYNVNYQTLMNAARGRTWRHIREST